MTDQHTQNTDPRPCLHGDYHQPGQCPEANAIDEERAKFTAGLRAMADWFDQHPEIDLPYEADPRHHSGGVRFSIGIQEQYDYEDDDFVDDLPGRFAAAVKALGGARKKDATGGYMRVTRKFGPGVNVEIWAARDKVCEAVVVGTKKVEVQQLVRPAETITVVEEQDVIEWRCAPVLVPALGIADARAALNGGDAA